MHTWADQLVSGDDHMDVAVIVVVAAAVCVRAVVLWCGYTCGFYLPAF